MTRTSALRQTSPKSDRPDIAFIDLETSGLKPWENEIVEIAVVRVDGKTLEIKKQMTCKTKPTKPVSPDAARVNGYTPEKWKDAIAIEHGLKLMFPLIEGAMIEPWIFHGIIPHAGLDELIKLFGLPPRGEHSALQDALMAREVYERIVFDFDVNKWHTLQAGKS